MNIREQIDYELQAGCLSEKFGGKEWRNRRIKNILDHIKAEIEKIENPYESNPNNSDIVYGKEKGFEACRQAILKKLEEK